MLGTSASGRSLPARSSTTRRRRPWVSRFRVARTRTAGTTIRSTSMHPGATTSRASPPATPARSAGAGRWPRAAPTMPATAAVPVPRCNYDASAPSIDRVTLDRPADSNGWYNHAVSRDVPRHRQRLGHQLVHGYLLLRARHDRARPSTAPARTGQATASAARHQRSSTTRLRRPSRTSGSTGTTALPR